MGADGGAPGSAGHSGRVGSVGSLDIPPLQQCLPLESMSLGSQKYGPGELRRVLGYLGNASENQPFGGSHFRLPPPVATEELKHYKDGVLDGFKKARSNAIHFSSSRSPSPLVKGKSCRESRPGPFMMVNSSSDIQASSNASEDWDPANKVQSLSVMHNNQQSTNSLHSMTHWIGQRPQKISRTRRANVVPPTSNYDEADDLSPNPVASLFGIRKSSNGSSTSVASTDVDNTVQNSKMKLEHTPSPNRLPEAKRIKDLDHEAKEKVQSSAVISSNGKVRGTVFPTKKNRALGDEDAGDGSWRQGKVGRALPSPKLGVLQMGEKPENVATTRSLPNVKPVNEKCK